MWLLASFVLMIFCNWLQSRQQRRIKKQNEKAGRKPADSLQTPPVSPRPPMPEGAQQPAATGSEPAAAVAASQQPPTAATSQEPASTDPQQPAPAAGSQQARQGEPQQTKQDKTQQPEQDESQKPKSLFQRLVMPNNPEWYIMNRAHNLAQEPRCSNWKCKSEPMSISMDPSGWICHKCGKFMPFDVWYPDYQRKEDKTDDEFDEKYMAPVRGIIRLAIALFIIRKIIWVFS